MVFTFKEVAEILKIIDASQCQEVVVELEGLRLEVRRGNSNGARSNDRQDLPPQATATGPLPNAPARKTTGSPVTTSAGGIMAQTAVPEGRVAVRAPTVGTLYRRPSPEEVPFVEIGQPVKQGDTLCLIEVMKLYTTISAPADGVLEAIAVEDGATVEFDQLLFVIRPDA